MARQQRIQVDSTGLPAPVVDPTAAPVDTYRGPGTAGAQLAQLAKGLASLEPGVGQFAQAVAQKQRSDDEKQAAADVFKAHYQQGKSAAKAIRDGSMQPTESSYYMKSFKERYGRVTADEFLPYLRGKMEANKDLTDATDPAQAQGLFDYVAQSAVNEYLKEKGGGSADDADFRVGFDNRAAAYIAQEKAAYIKSINSRVKKLNDDAVFSEIHHSLFDGISKNVDPKVITSEINKSMSDAIASGQDGTAVTHAAVDAFAAAALADPLHGDQILSMIKDLKGGSGSLGDSKYALSTIDKVGQELFKRKQQAAVAQREQDALDKQNREMTAYSSAFDWMQKHPGDSSGLLQIASTVKDVPGAFRSILGIRDDFGKLKYADDPDVKQELGIGVWDTPATTTPEKIVALMKDRKLTLGSAIELMNQIQMRRHVDGADGGDGIGDPRLKTAYKLALTNLRKTLGEKDPMQPISPKTAKRIRDATAMFHQRFYDALENHTIPEDRGHWEKWLNDMGEQIRQYEDPTGQSVLHDNAPPPAKFAKTRADLEKALPPKPVLNLDDIDQIHNKGIVSPNLGKWMNKLGIADDADSLGIFLNMQNELLKKEHVKE